MGVSGTVGTVPVVAVVVAEASAVVDKELILVDREDPDMVVLNVRSLSVHNVYIQAI